MDELTLADIDFIQESLKYTRLRFEEYQKYPSYEYKLKRLEDVALVAGKVAALKAKMKDSSN